MESDKTVIFSMITVGIVAFTIFSLIGFINYLAFESSIHNGWKITIAILSLLTLAGFSMKWSNK